MRENRMEQPDIRSMYPEELKERMVQLGEKPFRGAQLFGWLHQKLADSYDQMSNLPAGLRQKLEEQYPLRLPEAGGRADLKTGRNQEISVSAL